MDNIIQIIIGHYNYWIVIILMMIGFYVVISRGNLIKKLVGLNIFQTSVFLLYISIGKVTGGTAPILVGTASSDTSPLYTNPLTSVLILTAIVVGVATTALGLALVVRIKESYGTMEEDEIIDMDQAEDKAERDAILARTSAEIAEGHSS